MASRTLEVRVTGVDAGGKAVLTGFAAEADRVGRKMQSVGMKMSIGLTAPLMLAARAAFHEMEGAQAATAQTNATIRSTGGIANVTTRQVQALSGALMEKSGVDDELIQSGANLLLTFKNVRNEVGKGNDVFNRATTAALDLSTAGFGDMTATSKMLGKALNDPIAGMTALGKAGVTFSSEQKTAIARMVETGDILGAQKLILKEVESQVGGSAEAYGTTLAGNVGRAREALLNMAGSILSTAAPAFDVISSGAQEFAGFMEGLPGPAKAVVAGLTGIVAVAGPAVYVIGGLARNFAAFSATALGTKTISGLKGLASGFAGLGGPAAAITGIVAIGVAIDQTVGTSGQATRSIDKMKRAWADLSSVKDSNLLAKFNDLKLISGELGDFAGSKLIRFREVAEGSVGTAERLIAVMERNGISTGRYRKILDDVAGAQEHASDGSRRNADHLRDEGYAAANTADQIQRLNDAVNESVNAQLGVQGALLNTEAATNSYNESVIKNGVESLETRQAAHQLEGSYVAVADAIRKNADANRDGKVSAAEAKTATQNQIDTLTFMAGTLAPGSALRVFLDAYINQLRTGIPTSVGTAVTADDQATPKINDVGWHLGRLNGQNATITISAHGSADFGGQLFSKLFGRAGGGIVQRGEVTLVGEHGPEIAEYPPGTRIIPAGKTASLLRKVGSGAQVMAQARLSGASAASGLAAKVEQHFHFHGPIDPVAAADEFSWALRTAGV